jgi:hypothetical protein
MRRSLRLLALAGGAGLLALSGPARADYCRSKACDDEPAYADVWQETPDPPCDRDAQGCLLAGQPLFWPQSCISFSVQRDGSKKQDIDYETVHAIVQASFDTWLNADCGDGATPGVVIADYGPVSCDIPQYNDDQGNANVFLFREDEWPHVGADNALALTTVSYDPETGLIYDADVEINAVGGHFTTTDAREDVRDDLLSVLTHECGHFLGLSHDPDPDATMYKTYARGDLGPRDLLANDTAGICAIYPPVSDLVSDHCAPRHGFSPECGVQKTAESGCGMSRKRSGASSPAGIAILFGLGFLARCAKRRSRSR